MRLFLALVGILLLSVAPATAAVKSVTYYLDGARVETVNDAKNGLLEVVLPNGTRADSIRVRPEGGSVIDRVEIHEARRGKKTALETNALEERKNLLRDRLKALEAREDIFLAAARSQSARAPRKTKNNPDPMASIRRGTDYAIAQLESVYALRRKTEKELAALEARLTSLRRTGGGGPVCRVWLSGKGSRLRISYFTQDWHWKPYYDFRLQGDGRVRMTLRASLSSPERAISLSVVPATYSRADGSDALPVTGSRQCEKIADYSFAVDAEAVYRGPAESLSFTFTNSADRDFPPGEASCYWRGEYLGSISFKGMRPKESLTLSYGMPSASQPTAGVPANGQ